MYRRSTGFIDWLFDSTMAKVGAALLVLALVLTYPIAYLTSGREATCTINSIDRVAKADQTGSDARIYTKECGVLENTDSWLYGKFNSADVQGGLQPGHTYRLEIAGWRFSLLSGFPNVIKVVEEVK
jgi:hypothetical protein